MHIISMLLRKKLYIYFFWNSFAKCLSGIALSSYGTPTPIFSCSQVDFLSLSVKPVAHKRKIGKTAAKHHREQYTSVKSCGWKTCFFRPTELGHHQNVMTFLLYAPLFRAKDFSDLHANKRLKEPGSEGFKDFNF